MKMFLLALALGVVPATNAAPISFTGTLATPESVFETAFSVAALSSVEIQTWGFGGGINGSGMAIPAGGFDPLVAVFSGTGAAATILTDAFGNPVAGADTLTSFVGNCPPAGTVTIGTGTGSAVCGDVLLTIGALAAGNYTLVLSDANYVPDAVNPGPPASTLLSDGFADLTGGVFQTCNTTSTGTTCITPGNSYAVDITLQSAGGSPGGGTSTPEPGTFGLLALGAAAAAAMRARKMHQSLSK
jgi:hypothetical protein